jgi:hypothetical protein
MSYPVSVTIMSTAARTSNLKLCMKTWSMRLRGEFPYRRVVISATTTRPSRLTNTSEIARNTFSSAMMSWASPHHGYQVELSGQDYSKIFPLDDSQVLAHTCANALTTVKRGLCDEETSSKHSRNQTSLQTCFLPPSPEFKAQPLMQK